MHTLLFRHTIARTLYEDVSANAPVFTTRTVLSDVSSSLVVTAKRKFVKYPFLNITVLDFKKHREPHFSGAYDIMIFIAYMQSNTLWCQPQISCCRMKRVGSAAYALQVSVGSIGMIVPLRSLILQGGALRTSVQKGATDLSAGSGSTAVGLKVHTTIEA